MDSILLSDITRIAWDFLNEVISLFFQMAPYLLLGFTVAGILSVTLKRSIVARHVGSPGLSSVVKAALLGVPLPLCSCAVVPTAGYLRQAGASKPSLLSFLISTPQTGVDSVIATYGMMGPVFAVLRPVIALFTGIAGGVSSMFFSSSEDAAGGEASDGGAADTGSSPAETEEAKAEKGTEERGIGPERATRGFSIPRAAGRAFHYAYVESIDDIALHFLFGLGVAGLISMLIPDGFLEGSLIADGLPGMLLMVLIGIPMYICSTSSIPVAVALMAAGISPGAAYVFLVAGPATNAATLAVLKRMLGFRSVLLYLGTIILGALIFGPLVNLVFAAGGWEPVVSSVAGEAHGTGLIEYISGGALALMIGAFFFRTLRSKLERRNTGPGNGAETSSLADRTVPGDGRVFREEGASWISMNIEGMTCAHCATTVRQALESVDGARSVSVDLKTGTARVRGHADENDLASAVKAQGYLVK